MADVDDGNAQGRGGAASEGDDPPVRRVTLNMLAAYNMAYFRKAAGLTQDELGECLGGWTKGAVSAAERSWDGKRVRQFDADLIGELARILRVPIPAFFLPPVVDGERIRYEICSPHAPDEGAPMSTLLSFVMPEAAREDTPAMRAYEERLTRAIRIYLPWAGEEVAARLRAQTTEEQLARTLGLARRNRAAFESLTDVIENILKDNDLLQDVLIQALQTSPEGQALIAQHRVPPDHREWQARLIEIGKELFGPRGPVRRSEISLLAAEAHRRGIIGPTTTAYAHVLDDGTYKLALPDDDDTSGE